MSEPRKLSDLRAPAPGTSALATWGLWRRIVKSPERLAEWRAEHPEQAAAEDRAIEEARAAGRERADSVRGGARPGQFSEEIRRRMLASGAPPERVADWLQPRDAPSDRLVRAWLADLERPEAPHLLILTGSSGAGKTVAALDALAWALRRKDRRPARFATTRALLALGRWGEDAPAWTCAMEARMLVLDELVGEGLDRYRADRLEELLCRRYDLGHPTVITSNLAPLALEDKRTFGERVASRLGDRRAVRIAECGTVDLRRKQ